MKKMLRTVAALALGGCLMAGNVMAATTTFSDAPSSYWGYTYITKAAQDGLVSGIGNGKFGVEDKLSNAQFTTMICNLFYKDEVMNYQNTYKPNEWWQSYMAVAYTKGLLSGTTVGELRQSSQTWSAQTVNSSMSRYDMAQVIKNVSDLQGWQSATTLEILSAKMKIADWDQIPTKYQNAVASAYAKGFLSGMETGNFEGSSAMTRTHGAVVVCKLADAKKTGNATVYTNTTKLVNGSTATQANVKSALTMLKIEYPNNGSWDTTKTYTSTVLGSAYGCDAFAYTMSDRVFGNMSASKSKAGDLKPGDVVYLSSKRIYVIVVDVDEDDDEFTYAYCDTTGKITWNNTEDISDLGSKDTIYTRYSDTSSSSSSSGTLSDGSKATEKNALALIEKFYDKVADVGDTWDESYKSTAFANKSYSGSRGFAYRLSDYIFDDLEVSDTAGNKVDADDIRVGDVIYLYDDDVYGVVIEVDDDEVTYLYVNSSDKVRKSTFDAGDLNKNDTLYTRYPSSSSSSSSSSSKTLSNGKSATESNVKTLLKKFLDDDDGYSVGSTWNSSYKSTAFSSGSYSGSRGFAYYLSDYIFNKLEVTKTVGSKVDAENIRVGDVIYLDDDEVYGVVTEVDDDDVDYLYVGSSKKVRESSFDASDLGSNDALYSRYPSSSSSSSSSSKTKYLTNDKKATSSNVYALLSKYEDDDVYGDGETWKMTKSYSTEMFSNSCKGSKAFAAKLSDEVFGDLDYDSHYDPDDMKVGDVVYLYEDDVYVIVTDIDDTKFYYAYADEDGDIYWNVSMKLSKFDEDNDDIYTRY